MSRTYRLLLSSLLLAGLPIGCSRKAEEPAAAEEEKAANVKVVHARRKKLAEWTELPGTTQPLPGHVAWVTAPLGGRVRAVFPAESGKMVAEGDVIKAGQVIVQLDDVIPRAARDKAAAGLKEVESQDRQAELAVAAAHTELDAIKSVENSPNLRQPVVRQRAENALRSAEAKRQEAQAKLGTGRAELKGLEEQLELYTLKAPITGRLGQVQAAPGQTLAAGAAVAEIVDLDEIDVLCLAPPSVIGKIALKQPARLRSANGDAGDDAPEGHVVFVGVQAQPETGSFPVKVRFPNKGLKLRSNEVARVRIETQPEKERWVIPEAALVQDQDPPQVVVASEEAEDEHTGKEEKKDEKGQAGDKKDDDKKPAPESKKESSREEHGDDKAPKKADEKDEKKPGADPKKDAKDEHADEKKEKPEAQGEKEAGGEKHEKLKAAYLDADLGVRDHDKGLVEILGLKDPDPKKKGEKISIGDALFIVEGASGLKDGDAVKAEEDKPEDKDEKKDEKDAKEEKKDKDEKKAP